jgi:hypothetical protein
MSIFSTPVQSFVSEKRRTLSLAIAKALSAFALIACLASPNAHAQDDQAQEAEDKLEFYARIPRYQRLFVVSDFTPVDKNSKYGEIDKLMDALPNTKPPSSFKKFCEELTNGRSYAGGVYEIRIDLKADSNESKEPYLSLFRYDRGQYPKIVGSIYYKDLQAVALDIDAKNGAFVQKNSGFPWRYFDYIKEEAEDRAMILDTLLMALENANTDPQTDSAGCRFGKVQHLARFGYAFRNYLTHQSMDQMKVDDEKINLKLGELPFPAPSNGGGKRQQQPKEDPGSKIAI